MTQSLVEQSEQEEWDIERDPDIDNAIALLDELLVNGDISKDSLWPWFIGERELIQQTKENLESLNS